MTVPRVRYYEGKQYETASETAHCKGCDLIEEPYPKCADHTNCKLVIWKHVSHD